MSSAERERALKDALRKIELHSCELLEWFLAHPEDFAGLRDKFSPDGNNACVKLGRLRVALLKFKRGEIPPPWLTNWQSAAMRLLDELKRLYPEIETFHHTWNAQKSLYDLLVARYCEYEDEESYRKEICNKLQVLQHKYRENSNAFNRLLVENRKSAPVVKPRKKTTDSKTAARRDEKRKLLRVICEKYKEATKKGRHVSYLNIVRQMKSQGDTYSARLRGASAETWANQASSYGAQSRRSQAKTPEAEPCIAPVLDFSAPMPGVENPANDLDHDANDPITKTITNPITKTITKGAEAVMREVLANASMTTEEISAKLSLSVAGVRYHLANLRKANIIRRVGTKGGHWEVTP